MPFFFCNSVATLICGRPTNFLLAQARRCGASMTHPVVPVQWYVSNPASFSGKYGSPPIRVNRISTQIKIQNEILHHNEKMNQWGRIFFYNILTQNKDEKSTAYTDTYHSQK